MKHITFAPDERVFVARMCKFIAILSLIIFACMFFSGARADTVTLTWVNPTTYTDGTPLDPTKITGTVVDCHGHDALADCEYPTFSDKTSPAGSTKFLYDVGTIPAAGTKFCFRLKTLTADSASDWTPDVCKIFPPAPKKPSPPSNQQTG